MRKLKNVELVGKTRLIPGVGHVVMAEEMHEYVAVACEKAGLDWFEAGDTVELVTGDSVTAELVTGDAEQASAADVADENANVVTGTRKKK